MAGRILIAIIALLLLFGLSTVITTGITDLRAEDLTQNTVVETAAGITTANVVLTRDLYQDSTTHIISITSSIAETPVATTYTAATNTLAIAALTAETSRTLTIVHKSQIDDTYMAIIGPFLMFLIFGGIVGAILYSVWKKR